MSVRILRTSLLSFTFLCLSALGFGSLQGQEQERPADWQVRFDRPDSDPAGLEFVTMTPGWHITTGPAGILWNPSQVADGNYLIETDIHLFDPGERREAFGLFFGGEDLQGEAQAYTYFLIRRTGEFLVKARAGADTENLIGWTAHGAIHPWPETTDESSIMNTIGVRIEANEAVFLVNDQEVGRLPRSAVRTSGVVGLRVNHGLNLHVSRLEVTGM